MKKSFSLSIPKPCHENWQNFSPTAHGGFCSSCQKEVVDFSTWSEDDIANYFKRNTQPTCGRFQTHQLKTYQVVEPQWVPVPNWVPWSMLGFTLLLARPAKAQQSTGSVCSVPKAITKGFVESIAPSKKDPLFSVKVSGIVVDAHQQPVPGATVTVKGTSIGAFTDAEGCFSLARPTPAFSDTLVVSFIGYQQRQVSVEGNSEVTIELIEEVTGEVIVSGGVINRQRNFLGKLWWRFKNVFR